MGEGRLRIGAREGVMGRVFGRGVCEGIEEKKRKAKRGKGGLALLAFLVCTCTRADTSCRVHGKASIG